MSVENIIKLLRAVERSLEDVPRNDYEASNRFLTNVEKLTDARKQLSAFSGDHIDELHKKLEALFAMNEERKTLTLGTGSALSAQKGAALGAGAFALDFALEGGDGGAEIEDEVLEAERALDAGGKKKKKKEKKSGKDEKKSDGQRHKKTKKGQNSLDEGTEGDDEALECPNTLTSTKREQGDSTGSGTPPPQSAAPPAVAPLSHDKDVLSSAIPADIVGTSGVCAPVVGTALARIDFPAAVLDWDGRACFCRVELYRSVLLALVYGAPKSMVPSVPPVWSQKGGDDVGNEAPVEEENLDGQIDEEEYEQYGDAAVEEDDEAAQLRLLSQELVVQYDAAQAEKEEGEWRTSFPAEFPARLVPALRSVSTQPWVVLMCLGGYFAGGVFYNGRCVRHKSFQRYVVRKKQGGRQSTNAKDGGGSYGSIGSQIRAAQETKWKLEVRDLLIAWRDDIDAAALILYAAPGPQNRLMLTDFSSLPPPSGGKRVESPLSLQDPRVRRVPLTTHRPTFQEVQRVYDTVSRVSVAYIPL